MRYSTKTPVACDVLVSLAVDKLVSLRMESNQCAFKGLSADRRHAMKRKILPKNVVTCPGAFMSSAFELNTNHRCFADKIVGVFVQGKR